MKIGFTGTRRGMTLDQQQAFITLIQTLAPTELHHGSCQGADAKAARLARANLMKVTIHAHPGPDGDEWRETSGVDDFRHIPNTHFARNREIVAFTDALIATPAEKDHQMRGGTWYTIDHALVKGKTVWIIEPDGTIKEVGNGNSL